MHTFHSIGKPYNYLPSHDQELFLSGGDWLCIPEGSTPDKLSVYLRRMNGPSTFNLIKTLIYAGSTKCLNSFTLWLAGGCSLSSSPDHASIKNEHGYDEP